jgi:HptB-dependent secretion and biofilm anti anti-sigma factor
MDYKIEDGPDETVFRLAGRMTFADHDGFREILSQAEDRQGRRVVFDLSGLDFVDSSGLGMFIIARDMALKRDRGFLLRGARGEVRSLIAVAKFHKMFDITD